MQIPDSPAAVSSLGSVSITKATVLWMNGKAMRFGASQKTCKTKSKNRPFEESGGCNNVEFTIFFCVYEERKDVAA